MTAPTLLDTDILSEVLKRRDVNVQRHAQAYLANHGRFQFSIITRYEILRGLKAKDAFQQILAFDRQCAWSIVLPLNDGIIVQAAEIYGGLKKQGAIIGDADILIAATAIFHDLPLVTGNLDHFRRIPKLRCETWRSPARP
jgi:tRNA(fMet)-specific endonuclease VapC